jgi:hypothetical protein
MAKALMGYALLGFALCESVRLFRLLVTFLILFGSKESFIFFLKKEKISFHFFYKNF